MRESANGGGVERQKERERGRIPSRQRADSKEFDVGLELMNHEIMT